MNKLLMLLSVSSFAQSCPTLCGPVDCSTPGLPAAPWTAARQASLPWQQYILNYTMPIQLSLEQHKFGLGRCIYMWTFLMQYYTVRDWLNLWMQSHRYRGPTVKLHQDFQQHRWWGTPKPVLFRSQWCIILRKKPIFQKDIQIEFLKLKQQQQLWLVFRKTYPKGFQQPAEPCSCASQVSVSGSV